jgi:type IX secretion system PorP/SprF family membrane protein
MIIMNKVIAAVLALLVVNISLAQDPGFSQFFSSPLNVNPALTGNINTKWRVLSNYRSQWSGPGEPYTTGTLSIDSKIFMNDVGNYVDENFRVGIGGMMLYDEVMGGALKSNYASFNVSGNILLGAAGGRDVNTGWKIRHRSHVNSENTIDHRLGVGLGVIYGNKRFNVDKLSFEEQFTGTGFNINLPTGEAALSQMKPYVSVSAGLLYSLVSENATMDIGVSAFHFNKPKQTFLSDNKQYLPTRYAAHANLETYLSEHVILNSNGIYQQQSGASYFSIGGALGYLFQQNERDIIINGGLWYWSKNALVPYAGFSYGNFQFGFTYDITISKLNEAAIRPNTYEVSMILRGGAKKIGFIPTPWK